MVDPAVVAALKQRSIEPALCSPAERIEAVSREIKIHSADLFGMLDGADVDTLKRLKAEADKLTRLFDVLFCECDLKEPVDMDALVTITETPSENGSGLWRFRTSDGTRYATKNCLMASLAKACCERKQPVTIESFPGFYYREVFAIHPVTEASNEPV